jgi:glycosyltransferase involved in cell wall biosynthesis
VDTGNRVIIIIPTYNNDKTIENVINDVKNYSKDILVVNDGSTDSTSAILEIIPHIQIIELPINKGKGAALQAGFTYACNNNYTHAITFDADGQHIAEDIPLFIDKINEEPGTFWVGDRILPFEKGVDQPPRSRFGRKFGAFWFKFYTGTYLRDTQSGFRAYPLKEIGNLECHSPRYEFEIEILIAAAWSKIPVKSFPIHLFYFSKEERVSHFRPIRDFIRISKINSKAAIAKIFLPSHLLKEKGLSIRHKFKSLINYELKANATPVKAALSLALGVFVGISPTHGVQVVSMLAIAFIFKLNRPLSLLGISVSTFPLIPFWLTLGYGAGVICFPDSYTIPIVNALNPYIPQWAKNTLLHLASYINLQSRSIAIACVQCFLGTWVVAFISGIATYFISLPLLKKLNDKNSSV